MPRVPPLAWPLIAGVTTALVIQEHVAFPFRNPWNVIGPLTEIRYNPSTNVLRFALLLAIPVAALFAASIMRADVRTRLQDLARQPYHRTPEPGRWSRSTLWTALLLFMALSLALNRSARTLELDLFHEGEALGAAVSWEAGSRPYSGIVFAHGAFEEPIKAVLGFRLFGRSIGAVRTVESIQKITTFVLLAYVVRALSPSGLTAVATLGVLSVGLATRWLAVQPRDLTTMVFLLAFVTLHRTVPSGVSGTGGRAAAACAFAFWSIATLGVSADRGLFLFACGALLMPWIWVAAIRHAPDRRKVVAGLAAGISAGILALGLAIRGDFRAFFDYVVLTMPRYWDLMDGYVFPMFDPPFLAAALLVVANSYVVILRLMAEAAAGADSLAERTFTRHGVEVALAVVALCFFRSVLGRADLPHLAPNLWPTCLLTLRLGWSLSRPANPQSRMRRAVLLAAATAGLMVAAAGAWRVFNSDLITRNFPLRVPDSRLIPANYVTTLQFFENNLGPQETFFAFNNEAIWYYFLNRPAPGRFYVPWFAVPEAFQRELVRDLEAARPRYVLYRNGSPATLLDGMPNERRLPLVAAYLDRHYHFSRQIDGNEIWVRTSPEVEP